MIREPIIDENDWNDEKRGTESGERRKKKQKKVLWRASSANMRGRIFIECFLDYPFRHQAVQGTEILGDTPRDNLDNVAKY